MQQTTRTKSTSRQRVQCKESHVILSTNNINVELILIYMYLHSIIIILNTPT